MNGAEGAAAAAAAAAIASAIKASGNIVRLDPNNFQKILERSEAPLVVIAPEGFSTKSEQPLPGTCEVVKADEGEV